MTYARSGLTMHREHLHEGGKPIGAVRDFRLDPDGKTRGMPIFSRSQIGQDARLDVDDGILQNASLRYKVLEHDPIDERGRLRVTRWQPIHADLVGTGADPNVGVNRSLEGSTMSEKIQGSDDELNEQKLLKKGAALERNRVAGIDEQFKAFQGQEFARSLRDECVADQDCTAEAAGLRLLTAIGKHQAAGDENAHISGAHSRSVFAGHDQLDKFVVGAFVAQAERYGLLTDDERKNYPAGNEFRGWSLLELGRSYYERAFGDSRGLDRMQLVGQLFTRSVTPGTAVHATSDFPAILENIANKALDRGWQRSPVTWDAWTNPGTAPNFLPFTRPTLSKFGELRKVAENANYLERKIKDKKEGGAIEKYGELTSLTREAVINDSLSAFNDITMDLGESANRTINLAVYRDTLAFDAGAGNFGPNMGETGFPVFDETNHGNNLAPGGVPDVTQLESMRARMARQTDNTDAGEGGPNPINYQPAFILVPTELGPQARALVAATTDPRAFSGTGQFNTTGGLVVVEDVALTDAAAWYLVSNRSTVEVTGLNGRPAPTIERENGWTVDAVHWKVRVEFDVVPRDWRSMQRNQGG